MTSEQALFLRDFLLQRVEEAHLVTMRVLCSIPEMQSDYRPHPWSRSAREMALHIVETELMLLGGIASGRFKREENEDNPLSLMTIANLAEYYDEQFSAAVERVRKLNVKQLTPYLSFYGVFRHPAVVFLTFLHDHTVHHRGQLSAYVREMGSKISLIKGLDGSFVSMGQPAMKYLWTERPSYDASELARAA